MAFWTRLLGVHSQSVPFPDRVVAARLGYDAGRAVRDEDLARQTPALWRCWLDRAGCLRSTGDAECDALLYRSGSFSLGHIVSVPFPCRDAGKKTTVRCTATVRVANPVALAGDTASWIPLQGTADDTVGKSALYMEQTAAGLGERIGQTLARTGYSLAALTALSDADRLALLGQTFAEAGFTVLSVQDWSVSSPETEARAESERLTAIAAVHTEHERLAFAMEEQLAAQERTVELAEADHRIELARKAQRYELDRHMYAAQVEEIEAQARQAKLATERAAKELERAAHQAAQAANEAEGAKLLRERLPHVLETAYRELVETQITDLGGELRGTVGQLIDSLGQTLAANGQALAAAGTEVVAAAGDFARLLQQASEHMASGLVETAAQSSLLLGELVQAVNATRETGSRMAAGREALAEGLGQALAQLASLQRQMAEGEQALARQARLVEERNAVLEQLSAAMPDGTRIVAQLGEVVGELGEALAGGKGDRLLAALQCLSQDNGMRPLDPRAAWLAEQTLASMAPDLPRAELHGGAARARLLDTFRAGVRYLANLALAIPVRLLLADADGKPRGVLDNLADRVVSRGSTLARLAPSVGHGDRFRVRFQSPVAGYLWVLAIGRFPHEQPRIIYPCRRDMEDSSATSPLWIEAGREWSFPDCAPALAGLGAIRLDDATGEGRHLHERIVVIVTRQRLRLVSSCPDGTDPVPVHLVDPLLPEDNDPPWDSIPAYFDPALLAFGPDCVCGMIEYLVAE